MNTALSTLGKLTANQSEVGIPVSNDAVDLIIKAEAYTYHREYITKTPELYQAETLKRIQRGAEVSMAAYVYGRRQLDQFRRSVHKVFDAADLLVTPTTPVPPFTISELLADLENLFTKELLTLHNTPPFNLLGRPRYPFRVVSPAMVCQLVCKSPVRPGVRRRFCASLTSTSKPRTGTTGNRI